MRFSFAFLVILLIPVACIAENEKAPAQRQLSSPEQKIFLGLLRTELGGKLDQLDLSQQQKVQIKAVLDAHLSRGEKLRTEYLELVADESDIAPEWMSQKNAENYKLLRVGIEEVLTGPQILLLDQVCRDRYLRMHGGNGDGIASALILADELSLTDGQRKELTLAIERIRKERAELMQRWEAGAMRHILEALPDEKAKKYREMVGERFNRELSEREIEK